MLYRIFRKIEQLKKARDRVIEVESLTPERMIDLGAEGVILDHDGILSAMGAEGPDETGEALIESLVDRFGHGKVYILSNSRSARSARFEHYEKQWPGVGYIMAARKPNATGLYQVVGLSGVPAEKIAVVDDGILTGILMAVENGAIPVYALRKELTETGWQKFWRLATTRFQLGLVKLVATTTGR